jgi:ribosomal protein S18 acetylase RimI-like enzyme
LNLKSRKGSRRNKPQKFIDYLKEWGKSKNILELRLEVYVENKSEIRVYKKTGFKKSLA